MSGSLKDLDYLVSKLRKIVPVNLQEILDNKSDITHNHNTAYYLKSEIDELLNEKVDSVQGKQLSTNDFTNVLKDKLDSLNSSTFSGSYTDLTNIPTTFAPSAHSHNDLYYTEAEIISLLAAKANTSHTHVKANITDFAHTHPQSDITGLTTDLTNIQNDVNTLQSDVTILQSDSIVNALIFG